MNTEQRLQAVANLQTNLIGLTRKLPYRHLYPTLTYTLHTLHPYYLWLSAVVVSALAIGTRGPRFESRVAPLFHSVATLGKLFTHTASPVSQLQETGV